MTHMTLCRLEDIDDPGSKGFELPWQGQTLALLVVRRDGQVRAYRNRCPHTGVELNWQPDLFLGPEEQDIQCSLHGARFRIDDGLCMHGPCLGQSLERLPVTVREGRILLDDGAGLT